MKTYLLLFLVFSLIIQISFGEGEQCGHQVNGTLCPNGLCCSKEGYCGTTKPYCGKGCQSQCDYVPPPTAPPPPYVPDVQCGRQVNGKLCPNGLCCSKEGFCGTTKPYCGKGCQSQCNYVPPPTAPPPPPYVPAVQCGRQVNGKLCPNGLCCSKEGFCGTTKPYCGKGCQSQCNYVPPPTAPPPPPYVPVLQCGHQANGKLCPNGLCCSKEGFCGTTEPYCDREKGCQSQCTLPAPAPAPTPTPPNPTIPRKVINILDAVI
ncbi:lectin-B-like [Raphanus sativus]|uniref:Lectin-B-like n=1 Tax=Raphanus sativus TaxID=3726 RepID=A0A6J0NWX0_RAPSA|nr:lectin-B-like [Raphanus sativus]XP_056854947.1 lectin-B-like [Raphanus sativus]